ncbi:MAG: hypothetical protein IKR34_01035, partial [Candidatus Gastranaerophilales bacterium]|nr:hypothetical protein [Candidatus Gastranaerophilales bacterium]
VKALANDKYDEFSEIYGKENVGILTGDRKENPLAPIVIMTTEIYDKQIESEFLNSENIGTVIYDEGHYISDMERGMAWENSIVGSAQRNIQILILSATIGNSEKFQNWILGLNPTQKISRIEVNPEERYVPLLHYFYSDGKFEPLIDGKISLDDKLTERQKRGIETLYRIKEDKDINETVSDEDIEATVFDLRKNIDSIGFDSSNISIYDLESVLKSSYGLGDDEVKAIANLLLTPENKVIKNFHSKPKSDNFARLVFDLKEKNMLPAIVYRLSRNKCEYTAREIAYDKTLCLTSDEEKKQIEEIIDSYIENNKYLGLFDKTERQNLINGVGTHHSGKAPDYKELVEELFRKKLLKVVVATSTLGVGIDMPAKSTVVNEVTYGQLSPDAKGIIQTPITVNEFHQMIGRAGRRGQDSIGNVIIYNPFVPNPKKPEDRFKINEEALIQEYLVSRPDDLNSSFRPSVSYLTQYYCDNKDNSELLNKIKKSFRVYLSEDKNIETENLSREFDKFTLWLSRMGYVTINDDEITVTPKGKLLAYSKNPNPIMFAEMLYHENLKDASVVELCQVAGYIGGSRRAEDTNIDSEFIGMLSKSAKNIQEKLGCLPKDATPQSSTEYDKMKTFFESKESRIKSKASHIDFAGKTYSNDVSGYYTYCWALLNQNRQSSIENFNTILTPYGECGSEELKNIYNDKAKEGDVYKIIAQSISVLKQMKYVCNCALENSVDFPNSEYWYSLREKCDEAIWLMNRPPISGIEKAELPAHMIVEDMPVNICPVCGEPMAKESEAKEYALKMLRFSGIKAREYIENGMKKGLLYPMTKSDDSSDFVFDSTAKEALELIKENTTKYPDENIRSIIKTLAQRYSDDTQLARMLILEDMQKIVKEAEIDEQLKTELLQLFDDFMSEIGEKSTEEFKSNKFLYKLKRILTVNNSEPDLYEILENKQKEMFGLENNPGKFFINLNKQTNEDIASVFANKNTAVAMKINSEDDFELGGIKNYIKVCAKCSDKRGKAPFDEWIKVIPDFESKFREYCDTIMKNAKDDSETEAYRAYTDSLWKKITEIK